MKDEITVTINPNNLPILAGEGSGIVINQEAEKSIVQLLEWKDLVDQAIDRVKELISDEAESIMPGFTGIKGEKIRISNRTYGSKYTFVPGVQADVAVVKEKVTASIDSSLVDKYLEATGELPKGIDHAQRTKSISISLADKPE